MRKVPDKNSATRAWVEAGIRTYPDAFARELRKGAMVRDLLGLDLNGLRSVLYDPNVRRFGEDMAHAGGSPTKFTIIVSNMIAHEVTIGDAVRVTSELELESASLRALKRVPWEQRKSFAWLDFVKEKVPLEKEGK